jgi:hypothetical protein
MELQQIINDKEIRIDFRELLYNLEHCIHHQANKSSQLQK